MWAGIAAVLMALSGCAVTDAQATATSPCPPDVVLGSQTPIVAATATSAENRPGLPASVVAALRAQGDGSETACVAVLSPNGQLTALPLTPRREDGEVEQGSRRGELLDANIAAVNTALGRLAATVDGLDLRGLLASALAAHPAPTTVYLLSSGVSTVMPVDLRAIGWNTDGHTLGIWLVDRQWMRPMPGWTVRFIGLGRTAGTQPSLPDPLRERLIATWIGVCQSLRTTRCEASPEPTPTGPSASTNVVPPVALPQPEQFGASLLLPEPALFRIGRADLQPGADTALGAVVQQARDRGLTLQVIGHTDAVTGTPAGNLLLSQQRAEAVRHRLTELGLPADRITATKGVGSATANADAERRDPRQIDRDRSVEIRWNS
jgi:outer membrane protein OmpA-like peptidoglycan-associated protein